MPQTTQPEQLSLLQPIMTFAPVSAQTVPSPAGPVLLDYWLTTVRESLRTSHTERL